LRIAVSGAHSLGKSTFVNDWVAARPGTIREEEPYRALGLHGPYEILFRDESNRLHNGIQLYYNLSRVLRYRCPSDQVIFDRAPADFIAYSQYTADCGTTDIDDSFVGTLVEPVRESLQSLDLIVFVPKTESAPVAMEDDGIRPVDHAYRDAVDEIFKQMYREDRYGLMAESSTAQLIELWGTRCQRIERLEAAIVAMRGKSANTEKDLGGLQI